MAIMGVEAEYTLLLAFGGGPPPGTSPCPSPSHRPGEGDLVEAVLPIGCVSSLLPILKTPPTSTTVSAKSPSPGRWEGDGHGEVPGGGPPYRTACSISHSPPSRANVTSQAGTARASRSSTPSS